MLSLNLKQIGKESERITKTKCFVNKHNWKKLNFLSEKDD